MQLIAGDGDGFHRITSYGPGWIAVDGEKCTQAILISAPQLLLLPAAAAPIGMLDLIAAVKANQDRFKPEVVLLGIGRSAARLPAEFSRSLAAAGIGCEAMNAVAACRTYNLLAAEGRSVMAAIVPPG